MTTPKQTAANKANAQKSTGPKTEAGKAVVAGNAISHGILSSRLFLEDESPDDFQALQDDLRQALIPPMGEEERAMLEQNVLEHGCRDPLVTWRGVLLDGHNRYAICQKHGIEFRTIEMEFDSIEQARVWMRNNQLGRRNLTPAWRLELQLANKDDLAKIGAVKRVESKIGNKNAAADKTSLSQIDNDEPTESKHNTQAASAINCSDGAGSEIRADGQ